MHKTPTVDHPSHTSNRNLISYKTYTLPTPIASDALGQNVGADDLQFPEIRVIVDQAKELLASVNKEIGLADTTTSVPNSLVAHRNALTEIIDSHSRLLSSIHRIPPEIFAKIFVLRAADDIHHALAGHYIPITLSHVSNRWHRMCLSIPQLWSNIYISVDVQSYASELTKLFLERSRALPLNIEIAAYEGPPSDGVMTTLQDTLQLLLEECHRWKTASFYFPTWAFHILQRESHEFPLLEMLQLSTYADDSDSSTPLILDVFAGAPKLREVILYVSDEQDDVTDLWSLSVIVHLPWGQVKKLDLEWGADEKLMMRDILLATINLEVLSVDAARQYDLSLAFQTTTMHHNLRSLTVCDTDNLLEYCVCPRLDTLAIIAQRECYYYSRIKENIISFVSRSRCIIRQFTLNIRTEETSLDLDDNLALQEYLALMPLLEKLELRTPRRNSSVRQARRVTHDLSYHCPGSSDNMPSFCSHLSHLSLAGWYHDGDMLIEMLQSRSGLSTQPFLPTALLSADISCPDVVFSAEAEHCFQKLIDQGMKLVIEGNQDELNGMVVGNTPPEVDAQESGLETQ